MLLRLQQAADFIMDKPKGFKERIVEGAGNLSGGQKQRLSIARALVRKPDIYIYDDSFSALDMKTDAVLRQALKPEVKNAIVIIVPNVFRQLWMRIRSLFWMRGVWQHRAAMRNY